MRRLLTILAALAAFAAAGAVAASGQAFQGIASGVAIATGAQSGSTLATINNGATSFTLTTTTSGSPASISIKIEGSTDNGTTYNICGSANTSTAAAQITCTGTYDHVRVNVTTLSGGTAPSIFWTLTSAVPAGAVTFSGAIPAGTNVIGHVITDTGSTTAVTALPAIPTGSNVIGHVIADTGSTTAVTALPAIPTGSNVIGHVIADTGSTTAVTALPSIPAGTNLIGKETPNDGTNSVTFDPCQYGVKVSVSINQTGNTKIISGTSAKKITWCYFHVVTATGQNVAVVEGTGSTCGTSTLGVSGFGGPSAATGWNFAANGGITMGNGGNQIGQESVAADDVCVFQSGAGQVSGGGTYTVN